MPEFTQDLEEDKFEWIGLTTFFKYKKFFDVFPWPKKRLLPVFYYDDDDFFFEKLYFRIEAAL